MPNPFSDFWNFLIGNTEDYNALGSWKYVLVVLFLALIAASVAIAVENWRNDPTQRTGAHLATWAIRVMVGGMWFQGMLWKLPLPVSDGLKFWIEQMGDRAAFGFQRDLATNLYLPYLHIFNPIVFLAEFTFAVSLILGLGTRLVSVLAIIFVLHLWLGIYAPGDPAEWPWSYVFLAMVLFFFALHGAGRSLGADALMRRHPPTDCSDVWWRSPGSGCSVGTIDNRGVTCAFAIVAKASEPCGTPATGRPDYAAEPGLKAASSGKPCR